MNERPLHLVLTSEASQEQAEALAAALLELRLVVCVSLYPVHSHYRWRGRLERSEEVQLLLKTTPELLLPLHSALLELHSYDTPEWIHWPAATSGAYGLWCEAELSPGVRPPDGSGTPGDGDPAG
jgi:periplasmic divalent cation tolerance protein